MSAYNSLSLLSAELSNTIYTSETIDNIVRDIEGGSGSNLSGIEEKLDEISSQNETINDNVLGLSQERDILARLSELEEKMNRVYGHDQSDDVLAYMISRVNPNTDEVNVHNIPESSSEQVTRVGDYVFKNFKSLVSVDFPNATTIGEEAFRNCISLKSVKLSAAQSFDLNAFDGCSALEEINCDSLTSIPNYAFNGCTSLKMLKSDTVERVGTGAFKGCGSLESVKLNNSSNTGLSAFANNVDLTDAEFENATTVENYAFHNCNKLSSLKLNNPVSIGQSYTFCNCSSINNNISCTNTELTCSGNNYLYSFWNSLTENATLYCPNLIHITQAWTFSKCHAKKICLPRLERISYKNYSGSNTSYGGFDRMDNISSLYFPELKYVLNGDSNYGTFQECQNLNWIYCPKLVGISDSDGGLQHKFLYNCYNLEYCDLGNINGLWWYSLRKIKEIKLLKTPNVWFFATPFGINNGSNQNSFWESASEFTTVDYVDYRDRTEVLSATVKYNLTAYNNATYQRYSKAYPTGTKFIVPDNLYEDWIQLSGWSDNVDNIIKQSDFEADPNHPEYPWVEDPLILEHYFD